MQNSISIHNNSLSQLQTEIKKNKKQNKVQPEPKLS